MAASPMNQRFLSQAQAKGHHNRQYLQARQPTRYPPDIHQVLCRRAGLGAGDAAFAERAEARMKALVQRTRILVLASHSDALIKMICNRAMLLEKGRLVAIGPVDEILDRYHKRLVMPVLVSSRE